MKHEHSLPAAASDLYAPVASDPAVNVGGRLRALREARRLSIRALAEASGLAVNTLSLIEHGKTSPSVSTLQQLAVALKLPISAFFEPEVPRSQVVFHKADQQQPTPFPHGALADLGAGMAQRTLEPLLLALDPEAGSGAQTIVHPGQEFVFCLEGQIAYTVAEQIYLLEPGDSLLFAATLPHGWQNLKAAPARALLVLCPVEPLSSAITRHSLSARS
ncbi:MAG: cupin domain-containing protein [Chloroflexales bacterium]|nr:cupin domain-containing protein [Chloroflexales bacterium]